MPEYLSPGVYVEEISTGAPPIEGVSTSTAGFLGPTERGPETPQLITSFLDYQRLVRWLHSRDIVPHLCRPGLLRQRRQAVLRVPDRA